MRVSGAEAVMQIALVYVVVLVRMLMRRLGIVQGLVGVGVVAVAMFVAVLVRMAVHAAVGMLVFVLMHVGVIVFMRVRMILSFDSGFALAAAAYATHGCCS